MSSSSSTSCVVGLDIYRLNGKVVPDASKYSNGSIVKVFDPFRDDLGEIPDPQNDRVKLRISWNVPSTATVLLIRVPVYAEGSYRLFDKRDGGKLLQPAPNRSLLVAAGGSGEREVWLEGTRTGIVDLLLVAMDPDYKPLCSDMARCTCISDTPMDGHILFVNPKATSHNDPYDDWLKNAAVDIEDALDIVQRFDNIVIAPLTFYEHDLEIPTSCCIAGVGGNHDGPVSFTKFQLSGSPIIHASNRRHFMITDSTVEGDLVIITGLRLFWGRINGLNQLGGSIINGEDAAAALRISFCWFERCRSWAGGGAIGWVYKHIGYIVTPPPPRKYLTCLRTRFWKCESQYPGGAICVQQPVESALASTIMGNLPPSINSGGLKMPLAFAEYSVQLDRCQFLQCEGGADPNAYPYYPFLGGGGAIAIYWPKHEQVPKNLMCSGAPLLAERCQFTSNKVRGVSIGGAIYIQGLLTSGSAFRGCSFTDNSAHDGGAIASPFMAIITIGPFDDGTPAFFSNNTARDGGGACYSTYFGFIRIAPNPNVPNGKRSDNIAIFKGNRGMGEGGCFQITSGSVLDLSGRILIEGNRGIRGGAIQTRNARVDVRNGVSITKNVAQVRGGGIFAFLIDDVETLFGNWKYPESGVVPSITRVLGSFIVQNECLGEGGGEPAAGAGGIDIMRVVSPPGRPSTYPVETPTRLLKIDVVGSVVDSNSNSGPGGNYSPVSTGGLRMRGSPIIGSGAAGIPGSPYLKGADDDTAVNYPSFDLKYFMTNVVSALSDTVAGYARWPNDTSPITLTAAIYIFDLMLWGGLNNTTYAAVDVVLSSRFSNNTFWQASSYPQIHQPPAAMQSRRPDQLIAALNRVQARANTPSARTDPPNLL